MKDTIDALKGQVVLQNKTVEAMVKTIDAQNTKITALQTLNVQNDDVVVTGNEGSSKIPGFPMLKIVIKQS